MTEKLVLIEREDGVAVITLNRPAQHNALNDQMKEQLLGGLDAIAGQREIRAVVLTGAGRSFCVGQDLGEHADALAVDAATAFSTVDRHYSPIIRLLALMPKPVIAAVNGTCVGAGLGLALACDLRVFSSSAKFGTAFTSIGLTCDSGLSTTLSRSVGDSRAHDLVLSARPFGVDEAVSWGIAGDVAEPDEVMTMALGQASKLAKGPTLAFAESKLLLAGAFENSLDEALDLEAAAQTRCGTSVDHSAAVTAFLAKQKPNFIGA
ncbi:MAG: enoyl-CoA hydratase/isomerase family protein [Marmoricola sp.]